MKKIICTVMICVMFVSSISVGGISASAQEQSRTDLGTMYVSKVNNIWTDPYTNCLMLITPGSTVSDIYYHRLYAVYDSTLGGYVVEKKVSSHRSYTQKVATNAIGLCFDYSPGTAKGAAEALRNFKVWCKIREGDLLTLSGIDVDAKTIETTGTWGSSDFVSNAKINVSTTRAPLSGTAYSDKVILALGDSVTSNGGWTEAVGDNINGYIINAGVGGDRTQEALARFDRDVTPYKPDIVLIMFAINDVVQYVYNDQTVVTYKKNLQTLYDKCASLGATVIFMTPNDIKTDKLNYSRYSAYGGLDACYKLFRDGIKEVAAANNCLVIDNYAKWQGLARDNYLIDTVHPNGEGHQIYIDTITNFLVDNCEKITGQQYKLEMVLTADAARTHKLTADGYLTGVRPGTTVAQLKSLFETDVSVDASKITTGTVVNGLDQNGKVIKTVVVIIRGDINGDGVLDQSDIIRIRQIFKGTNAGDTEASLKAADVNESGKINVTDYIAMKRFLLNTLDIYSR